MLSYVFGIVSAVSFGISNTYWKTANKTVKIQHLIFFRGLIASIFFGLFWLILSKSNTETTLIINKEATFLQYSLTALLCIICSLGLQFYLLSLNYTPVSITTTISSINIFGVITAIILFKEQLQLINIISLLIIAIGIILIHYTKINNKIFSWNKGASYALLASFFWGTTYALFKLPAKQIGAIPLAFILETSVMFTSLICILFSRNGFPKDQLYKKGNLIHYFILATLLIFGTIFYNLSIQRLPIILITILCTFQTVVSISLGIFIYKEKINKKQFLGIILILMSILLSKIVN